MIRIALPLAVQGTRKSRKGEHMDSKYQSEWFFKYRMESSKKGHAAWIFQWLVVVFIRLKGNRNGIFFVVVVC